MRVSRLTISSKSSPITPSQRSLTRLSLLKNDADPDRLFGPHNSNRSGKSAYALAGFKDMHGSAGLNQLVGRGHSRRTGPDDSDGLDRFLRGPSQPFIAEEMPDGRLSPKDGDPRKRPNESALRAVSSQSPDRRGRLRYFPDRCGWIPARMKAALPVRSGSNN